MIYISGLLQHCRAWKEPRHCDDEHQKLMQDAAGLDDEPLQTPIRPRLAPMLEELIFGQDQKQALRIERLLIATGVYLVALFLAYCCNVAGLMRDAHAMSVVVAAIVANMAFYYAIRSSANLRASDPSLTVPQVSIGILVNSYLVFHAGPARAVFLLGYVVAVAFATLKLHPRQVALVGCTAALIYGGIIGVDIAASGVTNDVLVEVLQWLVLLFVCPWFALIASHIRSGRSQLKESRERLVTATREHEAALKTIREQATRDELTGIFNRRHMTDALRRESSRTDRTHEPFCILMLDIDLFKNINDRVGHIAGDNVLIAVTRTIAPQLRAIDHFSRYGGEEFLVLMPSTSLDAALYAAERIRKCVAEAHTIEAGHVLRVTVSIGVAEYRAGGAVDVTLADADRALYRAKHNGRNRVENLRTPDTSQPGTRTA
jgi:diguanylate cyclase (GGDEF)-like protein